jgi:hypothetical protein
MLLTLSDIQQFKRIDKGEPLAKATLTLAATNQFLIREIGRDIRFGTHTQALSGTGTERIALKWWPVRSVTALGVNSTNWLPLQGQAEQWAGHRAAIELEEFPRYIETRGGYLWPEGRGNILSTYEGGFRPGEYRDLIEVGCQIFALLDIEHSTIGKSRTKLLENAVSEVLRDFTEYPFIMKVLRWYQGGW